MDTSHCSFTGSGLLSSCIIACSDPTASSETLSRVLKVDLGIFTLPLLLDAQVIDAFQGLWRCDSFVQAVRQGTSISIQEFKAGQCGEMLRD